jgi:hypothetical protein
MKRTFPAIVLCAAIIVASLILGNSWKRTHTDKERIRVTGMAKKNFEADLIVWRGQFKKKAFTMQEAYASIKKDASLTHDYLVKKGVNEKEMVFSSVNIIKDYRYVSGPQGQGSQVFDGYSLTQRIEIESKEVDKIEKISREVTELIDLGVEFYSQYPEYYYTKLSDLKIEMLAQASADARQRAEKIAEKAGSKLGPLRNASMGIFQITGQNSNEEFSWGGTYNTASKRKTASITVKLEFAVK